MTLGDVSDLIGSVLDLQLVHIIYIVWTCILEWGLWHHFVIAFSVFHKRPLSDKVDREYTLVKLQGKSSKLHSLYSELDLRYFSAHDCFENNHDHMPGSSKGRVH